MLDRNIYETACNEDYDGNSDNTATATAEDNVFLAHADKTGMVFRILLRQFVDELEKIPTEIWKK